jgi:hypothetical protein
MQIEARRWLAARYQCPVCGRDSASLMMPPTRFHRDYAPTCWGFKCNNAQMNIVERRYYTTFASDFYSTAGTLAKIGPFKVCDMVHPSIRHFKKWYIERRAELDRQAQEYFALERQRQAEGEARRQREREAAALLKEAERVARRVTQAGLMDAEEAARSVWETRTPLQEWDDGLGELDDFPF